jgi:hypothetical protein
VTLDRGARSGVGRAAAAVTAPGARLPILFGTTLFVSSALLFLIQPMFARMALPVLGGAPAIWNTALMFFQATLLAGYAYAHWSTERLGARRQAAVHGCLLVLALVSLPIAVPRGWTAPPLENPLFWLLALLVVSLGLPFFAVSSTAPLLQRWFSSTRHPAAPDPYFLYRASNLGSMLALLAYPALIEPTLRLAEQGEVWAHGYRLLVVLTLACAVAVRRWAAPPGRAPGALASRAPVETGTGVAVGRRLRWLALAFVPSSFMLAVTTYLTGEIASIPLLWVIPLALYLLSFVLVFARKPLGASFWVMVRVVQPFVVLQLLFFVVFEWTEPAPLVVALNLVALFVSAVVCHGRLARDRPAPEKLTEFYLWVALGGALGGAFNAVVAPAAFDSILEYPLAIVLACLLRREPEPDERAAASRRLDVLLPLALGLLTVGVVAVLDAAGVGRLLARVIAFALAILVCSTFASQPLRFAFGVAAVMLAGSLVIGARRDVLFAERTFFGVQRVVLDRQGGLHRLIHGNTLHGAQSTDPARRREPLTYYHRTGPVGDLFAEASGGAREPAVGVVGLGTGTLACYGQPGQRWTFYEIDPAVERIARDPDLFTFVEDCHEEVDVVLGDARLSLVHARDGQFGLIVVDAFNSSAIPVHLLTREAVQLYLDKLADGGVIAVHVTNRHLDLRPVLGDLARDAGLVALVRGDLEVGKEEVAAGKVGSVWVVLARSSRDLGRLAVDPRWEPLPLRPGSRVWTDDFSNILGVFRWE